MFGRVKHVRAGLNKFRHVWASLNRFGLEQTSLKYYRQVLREKFATKLTIRTRYQQQISRVLASFSNQRTLHECCCCWAFLKTNLQRSHSRLCMFFYVFPSAIVCSKTVIAYWTHDFAKSFKTKKRVSMIKYRLTDYKMLKL